MAPSQFSRENRPCQRAVAFRSRSLENSNDETTVLSCRDGCRDPRQRPRSLQFACPDNGVHFRNIFADFVTKPSTQTSATTSFLVLPDLCCAISRIVFTDSCCALPINEQVLTTITSASSALDGVPRTAEREHSHHHFAVDETQDNPGLRTQPWCEPPAKRTNAAIWQTSPTEQYPLVRSNQACNLFILPPHSRRPSKPNKAFPARPLAFRSKPGICFPPATPYARQTKYNATPNPNDDHGSCRPPPQPAGRYRCDRNRIS